MSSLEQLLQNNEHWLDLLRFIKSGSVPGSMGIVMHVPWQRETALLLARHVLCETGTACGACKSCRSWVEDEHPDLLTAGEPDVPAPVEECRAKASDLSLSPVVAPVRLLVFYAPEKMSPGAVNSLLKITEEPPPHGHILYMMNKADILPTLRSRLWMLSFNIEEEIAPLCPPSKPSEWLEWLRANDKKDAQDWYAMAHGYAAWLCGQGRLERAGMLRQLAETAMTTHLSSAMWSDLLFLFLREEYSFENVFDDFWQATLPGIRGSR
ncbi:MAG: DNA polymerase III subunit delta' [Pyramidobacter sp.]|jgi:DNA polymerase-3 subunit delta'